MKHLKITPSWFTESRRRWIYDIGQAVALLLVGYGIVTTELSLLWLALVAAVLRLARENVPRNASDGNPAQ